MRAQSYHRVLARPGAEYHVTYLTVKCRDSMAHRNQKSDCRGIIVLFRWKTVYNHILCADRAVFGPGNGVIESIKTNHFTYSRMKHLLKV